MGIVKGVIGFVLGVAFFIGLIFLRKAKCPDCGAELEEAFYDPNIDKVVYKCPECGKEWV